MKKSIVIINFNTQKLTDACIRSVNKHTPGCNIFVFDNSDKEPFKNSFDNVQVIDNTKGEIINFEKWLENYPTNKKSMEATKTKGSAKHCYTVEKCMSIFSNGFLLLDSDVLVKKDISWIWDENYMYCGDVIYQPNSKIKRVLPYVCYINSKMCLENNVHYFDDNYMHGLNKTAKSERYDTGAGFYLNAAKFPHKEFKHEDYIVHYKGGSWFDTYKNYEMHKKNGKREFLSDEEWLELNKEYWEDCQETANKTQNLKESSDIVPRKHEPEDKTKPVAPPREQKTTFLRMAKGNERKIGIIQK